MDPGPAVGIDFGSATSALAWCDPATGRAEVVPDDAGESRTPSLVFYGDGDPLVGHDAEIALQDALAESDPQLRADVLARLVRGIKRRLVAPPVFSVPGRGAVRPAETVAAVLAGLKHGAERRLFHRDVTRAVITCPAVSSRREQEVLREAAAIAGFAEVELLDEPTAAALAFHRLGHRHSDVLLVYDLGAGTFDLSVLVRADDDDRYVTPLRPEGDPRCGGDDFDRALYEHCDKVALRELDRRISPTDDVDLAFLARCREAKHALSSRPDARVRALLASPGPPVPFRHEVSRADFEDLIRPQVEETVRRTADLLDRARHQSHEVDAVVLIGGSTRVPLVERLLTERLPVVPQTYAHRDQAVALGAAYRAHAVWGERGVAAAPPAAPDIGVVSDDPVTRLRALAADCGAAPAHGRALAGRLRDGEQPVAATMCSFHLADDVLLVVTTARVIWVESRPTSSRFGAIEADELTSADADGATLRLGTRSGPELTLTTWSPSRLGPVVAAAGRLGG